MVVTPINRKYYLKVEKCWFFFYIFWIFKSRPTKMIWELLYIMGMDGLIPKNLFFSCSRGHICMSMVWMYLSIPTYLKIRSKDIQIPFQIQILIKSKFQRCSNIIHFLSRLENSLKYRQINIFFG